jgi:hypothetical protein
VAALRLPRCALSQWWSVPPQHPRRPQRRQQPRRREHRFDPQEMALRGRIGAFRLHATHDPRETTKKARAAFDARFLREVDPEGVLPEEERFRRAHYARKAYFAQLARRRAAARRRRVPPAPAPRDSCPAAPSVSGVPAEPPERAPPQPAPGGGD